jgi:hypothetical protein
MLSDAANAVAIRAPRKSAHSSLSDGRDHTSGMGRRVDTTRPASVCGAHELSLRRSPRTHRCLSGRDGSLGSPGRASVHPAGTLWRTSARECHSATTGAGVRASGDAHEGGQGHEATRGGGAGCLETAQRDPCEAFTRGPQSRIDHPAGPGAQRGPSGHPTQRPTTRDIDSKCPEVHPPPPRLAHGANSHGYRCIEQRTDASPRAAQSSRSPEDEGAEARHIVLRQVASGTVAGRPTCLRATLHGLAGPSTGTADGAAARVRCGSRDTPMNATHAGCYGRRRRATAVSCR